MENRKILKIELRRLRMRKHFGHYEYKMLKYANIWIDSLLKKKKKKKKLKTHSKFSRGEPGQQWYANWLCLNKLNTNTTAKTAALALAAARNQICIVQIMLIIISSKNFKKPICFLQILCLCMRVFEIYKYI